MITMERKYLPSVKLDGATINQTGWQNVTASQSFSTEDIIATVMEVEGGYHWLLSEADGAKFGVYIIGTAPDQCTYAVPAGSSFKTMQSTTTIAATTEPTTTTMPTTKAATTTMATTTKAATTTMATTTTKEATTTMATTTTKEATTTMATTTKAATTTMATTTMATTTKMATTSVAESSTATAVPITGSHLNNVTIAHYYI